MAKHLQEVMNREVYSVSPLEPCGEVLAKLLDLGIGSAPVVDDNNLVCGVVSLRDLAGAPSHATTHERMTRCPTTLRVDASINEAARLLAETGLHHAPVVNTAGFLVGMVSLLDLARALFGVPAAHPASFPNFDPSTGVVWSRDSRLCWDEIEQVPEQPGVMALVQGGVGRNEQVEWSESCLNLKDRLSDLVRAPQPTRGRLCELLQQNDLRFRVAVMSNPIKRNQLLLQLRGVAQAKP